MPVRFDIWKIVAPALVGLNLIASARSVRAEQRPQKSDSTAVIVSDRDLVFERDVAPILTSLCVHCHGWVHRQGELDVRSLPLLLKGGKSGPAIVPGSAAKSLLVQKIATRQMPPTGKVKQELTGKNFIVANVAPTEENLATLRAWIDAGAPARYEGGPPTEDQAPALTQEDREWWAFQTPLRPVLPDVSTGAGVSPAGQGVTERNTIARRARTPIDLFAQARLRGAGLSFSVDAPPAVLMRRVWLDVVGLPPSPRQIETYLTDSAPDRYERLTDRLLASAHYGERWGRHWLDAAGYNEIRGREFGGKTTFLAEGIWRYRDYVINAFNEDLPFDRFLVEQLAGDELVAWRGAEHYTPEIRRSLIATGFLRLAADFTAPNNNGDLDAAPLRHQVLNDTLQIVGSNLLGLTLQCAQCHSHKFEPISQVDYYRLRALFTPAFDPQHWVDYVHRYQYEISAKELVILRRANAAIDAQVVDLEKQIAELRKDIKPEELNEEMKRQIADLKARAGRLAAGKGSPGEKIEAVWDVGPPPSQYLLRRGEFTDPGAEVSPGVPAVLDHLERPFEVPRTTADRKSSGYRTALARWLAAPDHPLTGRVFVNRIWQHYFGRGIVATSNNFGRSGQRPTHPDLLDWLAREFVDQRWQVKRVHRMILHSTTYRQSSAKPTGTDRARRVDPDNRLLWRMPLRQLESEVLRDAMLVVSGTLDRAMQGPSVPVVVTGDGLVEIGEAQVYRWSREKESIFADALKLASPSSRYRRSVYLFARRNYHLTELAVFDQPVVQTNCTQRSPSEVVQQALTMLNGKAVHALAVHFAARVRSEADAVQGSLIDRAFYIALGRQPMGEERIAAEMFLKKQTEFYRAADPQPSAQQSAESSLTDLCQMLLNTSEFLYVH